MMEDLNGQLPRAATHLARDYGKAIRTFSGASVRGHVVWVATYHDNTAECKTFRNEALFCKGFEAFSNLWGIALERPCPASERVKCKDEELNLNGTRVTTTIRVLDGSGYYFAVRFPDEVPSWRARQIIKDLGPSLIQRAAAAYLIGKEVGK